MNQQWLRKAEIAQRCMEVDVADIRRVISLGQAELAGFYTSCLVNAMRYYHAAMHNV